MGMLISLAGQKVKSLNTNNHNLKGEGILEGLIFYLTLVIGFLKNERKKSEKYISLVTSKYIKELVNCKDEFEIDYSTQELKNIIKFRLKYYTSLLEYYVKTQNRQYLNNQLYYLFFKNPLSSPKMTDSIELHNEIGANNIASKEFIDNINKLIVITSVQLAEIPGIK